MIGNRPLALSSLSLAILDGKAAREEGGGGGGAEGVGGGGVLQKQKS